MDLDFESKLSWKSTSSCDYDSEKYLENWKNRLHEVLMRRYAYMMKSPQWIGSKVCEPLRFDGTNGLDSFVCMYQMKIPKKDWLRALDVALKATLARWQSTHKRCIEEWSQCKMLMKIKFSTTSKYFGVKYTRKISSYRCMSRGMAGSTTTRVGT